MTKLEKFIDVLPSYYNKSPDSYVYNIIAAFSNEYETISEALDRIDKMIGISTTDINDLEYRWGSLVGIYKYENESDESYRARISMAIPALFGGTAEAITVSVAAALGIYGDQDKINESVQVYDAWNYTGTLIPDSDKVPAHIVVIIKYDQEYSAALDESLILAVNVNKAAGVMPHIIIQTFSANEYIDLNSIQYKRLSGVRYKQLGVQ